MRKRLLDYRMFISCLAGMLCFLTATLVASCQKETYVEDPVSSKNSPPQAEWSYLKFTTGYTVNEPLSDRNAEILYAALSRVKLSKSTGLWRLDNTSEVDVNISEQVFDYINRMIENSNAELMSKATLMSLPGERIPGEMQQQPDDQRNDCVAKSLDYIKKNFNFGPTYTVANDYIINNYGNGVPSNRMLPMLQHFYGPSNVSSFPVNSQNGMYNSRNSAVIFNYQTSDTTGHTVIYEGTSNGVHIVIDPQEGNKRRLVDSTDVISAFEVRK